MDDSCDATESEVEDDMRRRFKETSPEKLNSDRKRQRRDDQTVIRGSNNQNEKEMRAEMSMTPDKMSSTRNDDEEDVREKALLSSSQKCLEGGKKGKKPQENGIEVVENTTNDNGAFVNAAANQVQTESQYLNEQNLKQLERISECVKLKFSSFISEMIKEEDPISKEEEMINIFKKKPEIHIGRLQTRTLHVQRNKLSDKFNRRDIQFYDMYIKKESGEELARLKDAQFPLEINAEQYYNELEVDDFNKLFANDKLIDEKFGKSLKVKLSIGQRGDQIIRSVREHPELVKVTDKKELSPAKAQSKPQKQLLEKDKDPDLITLDQQLKQFERDFGKSSDQIADIFCRVSGRLNKMRDFLEGRPVVEWNFLEDLALTKPDESPEFQVLLQTKGWEEIKIRRDFLQATPVISEEEDKN